jgi:hypothetical protein
MKQNLTPAASAPMAMASLPFMIRRCRTAEAGSASERPWVARRTIDRHFPRPARLFHGFRVLCAEGLFQPLDYGVQGQAQHRAGRAQGGGCCVAPGRQVLFRYLERVSSGTPMAARPGSGRREPGPSDGGTPFPHPGPPAGPPGSQGEPSGSTPTRMMRCCARPGCATGVLM